MLLSCTIGEWRAYHADSLDAIATYGVNWYARASKRWKRDIRIPSAHKCASVCMGDTCNTSRQASTGSPLLPSRCSLTRLRLKFSFRMSSSICFKLASFSGRPFSTLHASGFLSFQPNRRLIIPTYPTSLTLLTTLSIFLCSGVMRCSM